MNVRSLLAILTGIIACAVSARAQYADTFLVTVADKTPEHPYYGEGYSKGYVVNGEQSPTITLVRGRLYLFNTGQVPPDLVFDFYTVPIGGGGNFYRDHVEEHIVSQGIWVIRATRETPDTLYYASTRQAWMGGTILIVDSLTSSVVESRERVVPSTLAAAGAYPNPFAEQTELRFSLEDRSTVRVEIVDALGQVVHVQDAGTMEADAGTVRLRVADLMPGIYLYRIEAVSEKMRSIATGKIQILQ